MTSIAREGRSAIRPTHRPRAEKPTRTLHHRHTPGTSRLAFRRAEQRCRPRQQSKRPRKQGAPQRKCRRRPQRAAARRPWREKAASKVVLGMRHRAVARIHRTISGPTAPRNAQQRRRVPGSAGSWSRLARSQREGRREARSLGRPTSACSRERLRFAFACSMDASELLNNECQQFSRRLKLEPLGDHQCSQRFPKLPIAVPDLVLRRAARHSKAPRYLLQTEPRSIPQHRRTMRALGQRPKKALGQTLCSYFPNRLLLLLGQQCLRLQASLHVEMLKGRIYGRTMPVFRRGTVDRVVARSWC